MRFLKTIRHGIGYKVLNSDGDTIIEVLICLAIVATLLGGAFTLTRSSRLGVRNSQEHTEALKVAENEIEQLRGNVSADQSIFAQTSDFCMYNQEPVPEAVTDPSSDSPSDYDPNCRQNSTGAPASTSDVPTFLIDISDCIYGGGCGNQIQHSHLYTITITWDQITVGNASEALVYRLYDNGGQTAFVGQTCQGTCKGAGKNKKNATYHWQRTFTNITPKYELPLITGCTWHYDDGSPDDHTACNPDDQQTHIFIPKILPVPSPYDPAYCGNNKYQVTLTENFSNGTNPFYQKEVDLPKCGPWVGP